mgnify:CR=1 FL=1
MRRRRQGGGRNVPSVQELQCESTFGGYSRSDSRTSRKRSSDPLGARICLSPVHVRADTRRGHAAQHAKVAHVVREARPFVADKARRRTAHELVDVAEAHPRTLALRRRERADDALLSTGRFTFLATDARKAVKRKQEKMIRGGAYGCPQMRSPASANCAQVA